MSDGVEHDSQEPPDRRGFLSASGLAMGGGLAASYGTLAFMAGQYLYTSNDPALAWLYVARVDQFDKTGSMDFITPSGAKVVIARQGEGNESGDFIALSSVCPHLGCAVHWESQNERFFCPCHNGAFDAQGNATLGPPAKANQRLLRYPLRVENDLLFIEAPVESVNGDSA